MSGAAGSVDNEVTASFLRRADAPADQVVEALSASYRFEKFELDIARAEVRHGDGRVALEPRAFDVLAHLVTHRERTVTVQELIDRVWGGAAVERGSVHRAVRLIRRTFERIEPSIELIQTIPRRGYRFLPSAQAFGESARTTQPAAYVARLEIEATIDAALGRVTSHSGESIVIHGPAGIGKSTTLEQIARRARQVGATVLHGKCIEGAAAPPYRPWLRILRQALLQDGPAEWTTGFGAHARDVARAFPEIAEALGVEARAASDLDRGSQTRVGDAIGNWIRSRAARAPLVLIFDDLHLADIDSIGLLTHFAQEMRDQPVLFVAAYRDRTQPGRTRDSLERLISLNPSSAHRLVEFEREMIAEFARSRSTEAWSDAELDLLADTSGGNPLFLEQLMARTPGDWTSAPGTPRDAGVQGILRRLLDDAPERGAQLLGFACVLGREFDPMVVATGLGLPIVDVQDALDELVELRILDRTGGAGRVRFVHALIPEELYAGLTARERAEHHRRALAAELSTRRGPRARLSELARHAHQAVELIGFDRAFGHVLEDARDAVQRLAFDEATQRYGRARQMHGADPAAMALCLLEQASAMVMSGHAEEARPLFVQVCAEARQLDDPILFAKAALGPLGFEEYFEPMSEQAALLDEAIDRIGERDDPLRIQLLQAVTQLSYYHERERGLEACREALELARRLGDRSLICSSALERSEALGWTERREERRALVREANEIAGHYSVSDRDRGTALRFAAHESLSAADGNAYRYQLLRVETFARDQKVAFFEWLAAVMRGNLAALEGRSGDAMHAIERQIELGRHSNPVLSLQIATVHRAILQILDGRTTALMETMESLVASFPEISPWRAVLALAQAESGDSARARETLLPLFASDFAPRHTDLLPICLAVAAQVAHRSGDAEAAQRIEAEFDNVQDPFIVVGIGMAGYGAAARYRGLCLETLGNFDAAIEHYGRAIETDRAMEAWPFSALGLGDLSRALRQRGRPGDAETAERSASEALRVARDVGLEGLIERLEVAAG